MSGWGGPSWDTLQLTQLDSWQGSDALALRCCSRLAAHAVRAPGGKEPTRADRLTPLCVTRLAQTISDITDSYEAPTMAIEGV